MRFLDEMTHQEWWGAQPWNFRLRHRVWWVWDSLWCVVVGLPGPGERLLMNHIGHARKASVEESSAPREIKRDVDDA